jgi:hypothetical protein
MNVIVKRRKNYKIYKIVTTIHNLVELNIDNHSITFPTRTLKESQIIQLQYYFIITTDPFKAWKTKYYSNEPILLILRP